MGRINNLRNRVAELLDASREEEPEPEGFSEERRGGVTLEGGYLEHDPPGEVDDYWDLYKGFGPINSAINNLATEVVEPGWYITCDNEDTQEKLTEYFKNVAILNTETDVNATNLMERMVIEREVRGTVFLEKVTDDEDRNQALYPLQNNTITIYTKPGKNMLPAPDDNKATPLPPERSRADTPVKDNGETAAYVQYDDTDPHWNSSVEVKFTRDQVIKWVRDADIGDARGTSRIASIMERAEGLIRKAESNDAAIESKAWPQIIFKLGTEENPYSYDEAEDFMGNYESETLEPGTMVGVSGDIDVEEFAGEVADISDALEFDVNAIMSGLPGPVFALGGFSENVAPAVAQQQQRQFTKEVKKTRRELENKFTPYLQEVAEDYDLDAADSVELHVGNPPDHIPPEDVQGSIIRYHSNAENAGEVESQTPSQANQSSDADQPARVSGGEEENTSVMFSDVEIPVNETEELADPRLVSTRTYTRDMSNMIEDVLIDARDSALEEFESKYSDTPISGAASFEGIAARSARNTLDESSLEQDVRNVMTEVIQDTLDTLSQNNHNPQIDTDFGIRHRQRAGSFSGTTEEEVGQAINDMMGSISTQVQRAAQNGETTSDVANRIREEWSDDELSNRADVIAHMEIQNTINSIKLDEYDRSEDVDGIKVINPCGPNTTRLCRDLSSCDGDAAVAWFDSSESISDQLESNTSTSNLYKGFNPLPSIPPFHFGCRSEIVPAQRE